MRRLLLFFVYMLGWAVPAGAQQATLQAGADRGCFQTIVVWDRATKTIRQFTRWGHKEYGEWIEGTPVPHARVNSYIVKEWRISRQAMEQVVGTKLFALLATNRKVIRSGHYNLSGCPDYDWETFAGDRFTTKDMRQGRLPLELLSDPKARNGTKPTKSAGGPHVIARR